MQKLGISQHYQLSKDAVLELFQERKYLDIFKKSYGLTDEGVHSFYRMCSPEITWKHPEDVGSKVADPLVSHHEDQELQKFNDCFEIWQDEEFEYQKARFPLCLGALISHHHVLTSKMCFGRFINDYNV